jgi:hypothetical protein
MVVKFASSCWMVGDMVSDALTTYTYHQVCRDSSYTTGSLQNHTNTNTNETKMIRSFGYFTARQGATYH